MSVPTAAPPRYGRLFWTGLLVGSGVIAYGVAGTFTEFGPPHPPDLARWVIGGLLAHDLVLAPIVGLIGLAVARVVPRLARPPVQAGLIASAVVIAVASPGLASLNERPGNPTVQPIDYRSATLTVLGVVWLLAGSWFAARVWAARGRRRVEVTLAVIAKAPSPGRAKTRLCPPCTPAEAARLARGALEDTMAAMERAPVAGARVVVLEGNPGSWLRPGFDVVPQRGGDLGDRLADAFAAVDSPAVVVAMDTPQVTPEMLANAAGALERPGTDAVLGLTDDGGYWAIGLRRSDRRVFEGVPMSSQRTGQAQLERLRELGLSVSLLPQLRDVDDFDDAVAVARGAPGTRFAAALHDIQRRKTG